MSKPAELWWAPVETVSNSEGGFERVYQGLGILASWPLSLAPGARWSVTMAHVATAARDRADEEAAAARKRGRGRSREARDPPRGASATT